MAEINEKKVTLTQTGNVRFGGELIGTWRGGRIGGGGYHYRPSAHAGESTYTAELNNGEHFRESGKKYLIKAIEKSLGRSETPA